MTNTEIDARFAALEAQRNEALNRLVIAHGQIVERDARIKELEAKIEKPEE